MQRILLDISIDYLTRLQLRKPFIYIAFILIIVLIIVLNKYIKKYLSTHKACEDDNIVKDSENNENKEDNQ